MTGPDARHLGKGCASGHFGFPVWLRFVRSAERSLKCSGNDRPPVASVAPLHIPKPCRGAIPQPIRFSVDFSTPYPRSNAVELAFSFAAVAQLPWPSSLGFSIAFPT